MYLPSEINLSSKMGQIRRRRLLQTATLAGITAIAGCLSNDNGIEEQEFPSFPDPVTAESALAFTEDYESATYHNSFIDGDYDEVNVGCSGVLAGESTGGYVVFTECGGATYRNDEVGDWFDVGTTFLVSDDNYNRATEFEVHNPDPFHTGEEPSGGGLGFEVVNFNDEAIEIDIEVVLDAADGHETIFETAQSVDAHGRHSFRGVTEVEEEYTTYFEPTDKESVSVEWTFEDRDWRQNHGMFILPDGTVDTLTFPDPD